MEVSGNRPKPLDHQPKLANPNRVSVGMPIIRDNAEAGVITCSCTWHHVHTRTKVREDRAQGHLDAKHNGQGLWL